jgi:predicted nuclease with TOPRIM domain
MSSRNFVQFPSFHSEKKEIQEHHEAFHSAPERLERMEQLTSDLIGFIAQTHAKTTNSEYQITELELMLARLEEQYKLLNETNSLLIRRLSSLEQQ